MTGFGSFTAVSSFAIATAFVSATALLSTEFFSVGVSCENGPIPVWGEPGTNRERTFLAVKHQMGGGPLDKQGLAKAMQCRQILSAVMFHCSLHCSE